MNIYDNEKRQSLDKYKGENDRYIFFPFNIPHFPLCKKLNNLTDLGKEQVA